MAAPPAFVWLEGERPSRINLQVQSEGVGHPEFLSERAWLRVAIDANQVEKHTPTDGVRVDYDFEVAKAGDYEIWTRIGYEFVRSPFEWCLNNGPWAAVGPEDLTTDLMELSFWTEVAWLRVATQPLAAGAHTFSIRLPRTQDDAGKNQRILFALDCVCLSGDPFHPYQFYKPGQDHQTAPDHAAAKTVFQLPESPSAPKRASVALSGLWEVCRHDEQFPGETAAPIRDFPAEPRWTAFSVPGDKNQRADLVFAHRLWFRTRVYVPPSHAQRAFFLVFPQNNLNTTVYVNGQFCGFDKNPFARVQIDVTRGIQSGATNEIRVGIKDAWYAFSTSPVNPLKLRKKFNLPIRFFDEGFQDLAYPVWAHPQSGILVAPQLVAAGRVYASDVFVQPSVAERELVAEVTLANGSGGDLSGELAWKAVPVEPGVSEQAFPAQPFRLRAHETKTITLTADWSNPRLWWPEDPQRYDLRTSLKVNGRMVDVSETRFGFREWTADGPDFRLNGIKWHGWADCFTASSPEAWAAFYRQTHQTTMRFWGTSWQGLPPDAALDFFDRQGIVCRRSGMLDGQRIGYHAMEQDPELRKRLGSPIKIQLMTNWIDQLVAQIKGERNHPSINVWSIENEWLYINCLNLHGGHLDEFEEWVTRASQAVRAADPTRFTMTDGGGANKDQSMPVHGNHYVFNSREPEQYPALAYEANPAGGGRGRWVWDQHRPRFIGEDYFATGINPFDYAYFGGEAAFQGKAQARPAAGLIYRMLMEGYRWAGQSAWHFWMNQNDAKDQYTANAPRAVFCRQWNWTFPGGQSVPRTFGLFNDTRSGDPITFTRALTVAGKETFSKSTTHQVPPGQREFWQEPLPLPAVQSRAEGQLVLTLAIQGQEVFRDQKNVSLLPPPKQAASEPRFSPFRDPASSGLAVLDPQGSVSHWFRRLNLQFTAVSDLHSIPEMARLLVLGPDALDLPEATSSRLAAWASSGRRAVVLEQNHPLKFQGLPCEMVAAQNEGRTAFIEDASHPALRGLRNKDFFTWGGDEVVYRNAYEKPTRGAKSLVQCHRRLQNSALVEVPVGQGLLLLSQLAIGANLKTNVVAQTLLLNLLQYAATYQLQFRPVTTAVQTDPLLAQTLQAIGLQHAKAPDALAALAAPNTRIAIIHANPKSLKQLADREAAVNQFCEAGGFLVLHGLGPAGLADYNRLVGFDHMIRPFGRERVALANPRHPLTAGLTTGDVVLRSGERIFGWTSDEFVANDMFTCVVDYRDVAPFATFEDDFKKLMVNGMVSADAWKYIVNLPLADCVFKLTWPKPQTFEAMTWVGNTFYYPATQAAFLFDGGHEAVFDLEPHNDPQDLEILPPRTAKEIAFRITRWNEVPDKRAISGLDNLHLYAARSPAFLARVKPLLNIGALMFYERGQGGILLANLHFKESEAVPENATKKRTILATLLRNLKAPFSGARTVIAGAPLHYEPIDLSQHYTAYRNERGWFGDPRFTFAGLPSGRQTFAGVPFQIFEFETSPVPTVVMLGGNRVPGNLPKEIRNIPLHRTADALFFLQAARLDRRMNPNDRNNRRQFELARYVVTYADGQTIPIPILAEIDLDNYKQQEPQPLPGAQIAWTRPWEGTEYTAVAYLKQWTNPRPEVELKSLDFLPGKDHRGVPVLLALTAGSAAD